jgi:hypothetical protein
LHSILCKFWRKNIRKTKRGDPMLSVP